MLQYVMRNPRHALLWLPECTYWPGRPFKGQAKQPMVGQGDVPCHTGAVITIVASSGGHVAAVERCAVTGAHAR